MGKSIEEQRQAIRESRNEKRFYKVKKPKVKNNKQPVKVKSKKEKKKEFVKKKNKYHNYLLSDEWAQLKIDLFQNRGRKCEYCGKTKDLHVHHKTYKNIFNEEPEDLIILCRKCHNKEHGVKGKVWSKQKKTLYLNVKNITLIN
jgi:5-methylcytosine-specific restriction endonuclease McrA